jgi:hypothetical protein
VKAKKLLIVPGKRRRLDERQELEKRASRSACVLQTAITS